MGQTVVFTVSLDAGDVAIEQNESRPPQHPFRDALLAALRDRRWYLAALLALAAPLVAATVTFALTGGDWVTTAYLAVAALATPASGAWAAARRTDGTWDERTAQLLAAALAGAALCVVHVPFVAWAARSEGWGEQGALPTLGVLALVGSAGACLGAALAARRVRGAAAVAVALTFAAALVPLGLYAALLPTTSATETISAYTFTPDYGSSRPLFICTTVPVEVTRLHTDDIAWIAMASPISWLVDAATFTPEELAKAADGSLAQAQAWVRSTRAGPDAFEGHCYAPTSLGVPPAVREARYATAAPLGAQVATVAAIVVAAFAFVAVSRRRSA